MKIIRLKKEEEINKIKTQTYFAKIIKKGEVKEYLKNHRTKELPNHLKLIKEYDQENVLILTNKSKTNKDYLEVKVPLNQPITLGQYKIAKEIWPCKYFIEKEKEIYIEYVISTINLIKQNDYTNLCTSFCLIRDDKEIYTIEYDTDNILGHSIFKAIEKVSQMKVGYLCTGLDAFIYSEPCLSCCMAFVHGRIKRVFVIGKGKNKTFSELRMCYNKLTNHRYEVYFIEE